MLAEPDRPVRLAGLPGLPDAPAAVAALREEWLADDAAAPAHHRTAP